MVGHASDPYVLGNDRAGCPVSERQAMTSQNDVSGHYTHGSLTAAIEAGIALLGKTPATITIDLTAARHLESRLAGLVAARDDLQGELEPDTG